MGAVAADRAMTYSILSALHLAAPAKGLADTIRAGGLFSGEAAAPVRAAANDLSAAFREAAQPVFENDLAAEHTRLFVLPSGVAPHESIYCDENTRLGGRVTEGVKRFYEHAGAELSTVCLELPDHIGVELEFMNFLCGVEAQLRLQAHTAGLLQCLGFQRDFLSEHLLRWYGPFCDRVLNLSNSGAYRALARLTAAFLEVEGSRVPGLSDELHSKSRTVCVPVT